MPGLALDEAISTSATGDLWLFRGRSLADRAIQTVTNAPVNHVGMVVALEDLPPLLWHAELGRSLPDVWTGERQRGVQLHVLADAVRTWGERYGQRAYLRQLEGELTRAHEDELIKVIERFDGRSFPSSAGLARQWVTGRYRRRESSLESVYCAELVATTYQAMGLLPSAPARELVRPGPLLERRPHRARAAVRARGRDRDQPTGTPAPQQLAQDLGRLRAGDGDAAVDDEGRDRVDADRRARSARRRAPRRRSGRSASISRTSSAGRPTSAASRTSVSWSETSSPSVWWARMSRSFISALQPVGGGELEQPVAVERVGAAGQVEAHVEPVAGGHVAEVLLPLRAPRSTLMPYFSARCSAPERSRAAGAAGSSSNERQRDLHVVAVLEAGERGLEAALADVAPGAGDVGPDLDVHVIEASERPRTRHSSAVASPASAVAISTAVSTGS